MFEQFLGTLLFLLGLQAGGSVRGESTPSALTAVSTASATMAANLLSKIETNDIKALQKDFLTRQEKSVDLWETKQASFTASLQAMRNEKKASIAAIVQARFIEMNYDQTTFLMGKLIVLNHASDTIRTKAQQYAKTSGKDASKVTAAIEKANKAIADAISALTVQAEKQYVISVSSEAKLKTEVESVKTTLAGDLKKVRDLVKNARKKVGDAFKALKTYTGSSESFMVNTGDTQ